MSDVVPRSISDAARLVAVAVGDGDAGGEDVLVVAASTVPASFATPSSVPVPKPATAVPTSTAATKAARRRGSSLDHQPTVGTWTFHST